MKSQSNRPDISEMPPYRLGRHWNTIQAYLIPGLEDDIGELSEELKKFMGICELLIDEKMFAKYRWCGNGRPPSSRISLFKAYILKAMCNYPYTKTLIAAARESPTVRRLCGWESVADIPLCAFLSSASMHDSQAMIPMMQRASASFDYFYDLADAAYDAARTRAMSQSLNHVPLIDGNPRRWEKQIDDVGAKFVNIVPA